MKRTTKAKPSQVIIPPQDEVYRGMQILWDGYIYWIVKPNSKIETSTNIEMIRAAIDLIHLTNAMKPVRDIDMTAVARMTEDEDTP